LSDALKKNERGVFLSVKATPKAAHTEISGCRNSQLLVKVTAPPEKGKANAAVVAVLAKTIGVPKSVFILVSGDTDRNKMFKLASHVDHVQSWLKNLPQD
jgi:uncharacterized protein